MNNNARPIDSTLTDKSNVTALDQRGLQSQTIAALALACAIPVLLIGYFTVHYVLPHADSKLEVYGTTGCALTLVGLGTFLIMRTVRQILFLTQATRSILQLHAAATAPTDESAPTGDNELLHLGLAITKMGEALRQQVAELQDKAQQLGQLNNRLEDANRKLGQYNEMKSNLMVLASREFRNPIGAIVEGAALVLQHQLGELNESQQRMVSVIHSNARKASRLLQELLTIARVRANNQDFSSREIDLKETLQRVVTHASIEASRRKIALTTHLPGPLIFQGYAQETELALECMLANALDIASEESAVSVGLEHVGPAAVIAIGLQPLKIRAISFERLAEALNAPVTTTQDWNGAGSIELPLAKEIINLIGGRIGIEQAPAGQLIFRISLPLTPPAPAH